MSTSDGRPVIELRRVSKRFGGTLALDAVDWSVAEGEIHCLVGENGSGKSTLIKLISGVHTPDAGSGILVDGTLHEGLTPQASKALGVQVIYQDLSLFPNLTVAENITIDALIGQPLGRTSRANSVATAREILGTLQHELDPDVIIETLPVADRQIVAIARGLAVNARVLFMDEPTASLTRHEVDRLFLMVRRLQGMGVAVVFVSHRLDEITQIAERVSVLRDGTLVGTYPVDDIDDHRLSELMTGDRFEHTVTANPSIDPDPVLEVECATRHGEFSDVSFTLQRGEILGLIGLLGSGRTELALSMFGMARLDAGAFRLERAPLRMQSNQDAIRAGIAYVSEDRLTLGLNLRQSIADNIAISVLDRLAGRFGLIGRGRRRDLASDWVEQLDIKAADVEAAAQTLSGGNQQRIVLAKWLATDPKVLILDSPTVGVDVRNKQGIYRIVRALADEGVSILMISDEVPEVYYHTDRVLHMQRGRIVGEFVPPTDGLEDLAEAIYA